MKRSIAEYVLITIGVVTFAASLFTAILDLEPYWTSVLFSLLTLIPFCLPWQGSKFPLLFLLSLVAPLYFSLIAFPQLISMDQALFGGEKMFEGLPMMIFIGFLNTHLLVIGTLLLTAYALSQTIKGRTLRFIQAPSAPNSKN